MSAPEKSVRRSRGKTPARPTPRGRGWKLEDAKARFSEVVRLAQNEGPQRVTVRGKDSVVVISAQELERLLPPRQRQPLVRFLEGLHLDGLALEREHDTGRDTAL